MNKPMSYEMVDLINILIKENKIPIDIKGEKYDIILVKKDKNCYEGLKDEDYKNIPEIPEDIRKILKQKINECIAYNYKKALLFENNY